MNDICLILPCNLYVIPYFKVYESMFAELNVKYDILIWNRSCIKEKCNGTILSYDVKDIANNRDPKKVFKYIGFYRFVKKHLRKHNYERVVFMDTSACTVALLGDFLKHNYYKKYWIDIRDYSFEHNFLYKKMLQKSIEASYCCDVSSKGFLKFLPKLHNYCVTHNVDYETIHKVQQLPILPSNKIRISFIGNVRYLELNQKLLDIFKNDSRYYLQYYGTGSEKLKKYCDDNKITNVDFVGRFPFEKTAQYYQKTDVINNIYGNETMEVATALSNKLYYSMYLNKPILVSPNTYMSEIVTKYNLGYVVDFDDEKIKDNLFAWYQKYINDSLNLKNEIIMNVENEFNEYLTQFKEFVSIN